MHRLRLSVALVIAFVTAAAHAQVSLNSVRVVAKDAEALGRFYAAAFGLKETNRLQTQSGPELFLNFGATAEAAAQYGTSGIFIAFVTDPEGNQIELIQPARR